MLSGVTWLAGIWGQTWAALMTTLIVLFVAAIITLLMLAFFPIFSLATGAQVSLKPDGLWILLAVVSFNGVGKETLFRGYVYGGLRREAGRPFRQAGFIFMIIFTAVHLMLFVI
jgi:membrane protease YdiL (CAAX protease family)